MRITMYTKLFSQILWYLVKSFPVVAACMYSDLLIRLHVLNSTAWFQKPHIVKAIIDNLGHGLVAAFLWLVVVDYQLYIKNCLQVLLCCGLAMAIDIDHFIQARSLSLKVSFLCKAR